MSADERYEAAQKDAVSKVILTALHRQDARTYNGNGGDIGGLALIAANAVRAVIAAEIETEHDSGAGFGDVWNQAIKRAASVARGERTPPVRPVDGGNP